ncbi:MAG: RagB/SusD family nutrient uptake outer membrane protein [Bacteroidales bacterium]|nr:RagB/SusD family nutrient uptake outer membrane protein [Bacteroidales bacterium]
MKNLNKILVLVLFLVLASCNQDKFLDIQPYDKITTDNLIVDYTTLKSATNGVYNIFQDPYYYDSYALILPDLMSDNVKNNNFYLFSDVDKYETKADNRYTEKVWEKISALITQSSIVIREAEQFDFGTDQEAANELIGQLYIARGIAYFDMQRFFAQPYNFTNDASHLGVPLIDEDKVGIDIISPARSTTKEVYDKILSDFNKGLSLIGNSVVSPYYLNEYSAKAFLARIYLYMENWTQANNLASEVIASGQYSLLSNEEYIDSWTLDETSESIFSIINTETDNARYSSINYYYIFRRFLATNDLYDSFDNNDVRRALISSNRVLKHSSFGFDNNIPVVRYSEMYLIKAEALAELGDDDGARGAVNMIHLRANPTALPITDSGDDLKRIIQEERRKELMFEGHRLFDLTRKKESFVKYSTSVGTPINIVYPNNFTILPIPQKEIDANDNISQDQQNPGY